MVSDLIDHDRAMWNESLLCPILNPRDMDAILQIPLVPFLPRGSWVWNYTKNRSFSVK